MNKQRISSILKAACLSLALLCGVTAFAQVANPVRICIYLKDGRMVQFDQKKYAEAKAQIQTLIDNGQNPYFVMGSDNTCKYLRGVLELVYIPPKTFNMGSSPSEVGHMADETRHEVKVSEGYWMGVFEVTQEQWKLVMGKEDTSFVSRLPQKGEQEVPALARGAGLPMYMVSHDEAMEFCEKLTLLVLRASAAKGYKGNFKLPDDWEFTLPTEAEWEYACRGRDAKSTPYYGGQVLLARYANFNVETIKRTVVQTTKNENNDDGPRRGPGGPEGPEGEKKEPAKVAVQEVPYTPVIRPVGCGSPNDLGLFDMHGGVWEWCKGRYYVYPSGREVDPQGGESGNTFVARGGCWYSLARDCRSASRWDIPGTMKQNNVGFRVVLKKRK